MSDPVPTSPLTPEELAALNALGGGDWIVVTVTSPPPPHFAYFKRAWVGGVRDLGKYRELLVQGLGWVAVTERMEYLRAMLDLPG